MILLTHLEWPGAVTDEKMRARPRSGALGCEECGEEMEYRAIIQYMNNVDLKAHNTLTVGNRGSDIKRGDN